MLKSFLVPRDDEISIILVPEEIPFELSKVERTNIEINNSKILASQGMKPSFKRKSENVLNTAATILKTIGGKRAREEFEDLKAKSKIAERKLLVEKINDAKLIAKAFSTFRTETTILFSRLEKSLDERREEFEKALLLNISSFQKAIKKFDSLGKSMEDASSFIESNVSLLRKRLENLKTIIPPIVFKEDFEDLLTELEEKTIAIEDDLARQVKFFGNSSIWKKYREEIELEEGYSADSTIELEKNEIESCLLHLKNFLRSVTQLLPLETFSFRNAKASLASLEQTPPPPHHCFRYSALYSKFREEILKSVKEETGIISLELLQNIRLNLNMSLNYLARKTADEGEVIQTRQLLDEISSYIKSKKFDGNFNALVCTKIILEFSQLFKNITERQSGPESFNLIDEVKTFRFPSATCSGLVPNLRELLIRFIFDLSTRGRLQASTVSKMRNLCEKSERSLTPSKIKIIRKNIGLVTSV